MFEHYAFSAKRKFGDVHYVKNEKFIELSLDELMSHLKEVSAFFVIIYLILNLLSYLLI